MIMRAVPAVVLLLICLPFFTHGQKGAFNVGIFPYYGNERPYYRCSGISPWVLYSITERVSGGISYTYHHSEPSSPAYGADVVDSHTFGPVIRYRQRIRKKWFAFAQVEYGIGWLRGHGSIDVSYSYKSKSNLLRVGLGSAANIHKSISVFGIINYGRLYDAWREGYSYGAGLSVLLARS